MLSAENQTREKILISALSLFAEMGVRKTSLSEVAYRAGVTRVTVYRYFSDKKDLVLHAFLHGEQVFQKALDELQANPNADWQRILDQIGEDLSALPSGDVFARFDEIKRLYPDVYAAIQKVRVATLTGIFEHLFIHAESHKVLRPGLNRQIVQAIFWELIINIFDNPRFESIGLSDAELYRAMTDILLHGICIN